MIIIVWSDHFSSDDAHTNVGYAVKTAEGFIEKIFLNHLRQPKN